MADINPKFIAVIILAAILIATGMYYYHADYQAKPYEILKPIFFANEQPMLAFGQEGSSAAPIGNATINITGQANYHLGAFGSKLLYVYDFPWYVKMFTSSNGVFHFTLLKYGTFTLGFKALGYKTTYTTLTVLRGNSYNLNVYMHRAINYNISGKTINSTGANVPFVAIEFTSFFGNFTGNSGSNGNYSMQPQNGTYLISTFKGGYGVFPKPKFLNVTGSNVQDLNLVMNKTKSNVFYVSGIVRNKLGVPLPGVLVSNPRSISGGPVIPNNKIYTNSTGFYIIPVPTGANVLNYSNVAYLTNNSGTLMVKSNITHNETLTSIDPFTGLKGPTGLSFLPSFMQLNSFKYLTGNISSVKFSVLYPGGKNLGVNVVNTFYTGNPNSGAFFKGMNGVVAVDVNGTIYYQSFKMLNSSGILNANSYFPGNFHIIVYFQGFNYSDVSFNVPGSSSTVDYLTPLPGQFFNITVNSTNNLDGQKLAFTNNTLIENGVTVNSTSLINESTFYYFLDLKQNYSINLQAEVNETGFNLGSVSFTATSLNGKPTVSISPKITIKLNPLKSIGTGIANTSLKIPGFTQAELLRNITDSSTSNIYNTGPSSYLANISNPGKGTTGYRYIMAAEVNGVVYSTVVNFSSVMSFKLNFSGFYSGSFNFILIGQFWRSHNINFGFTPGKTTYGGNSNEAFFARNLSVVNVSVASKFSLDFHQYSNQVTNNSVPVQGSLVGNYTIPLYYSSVFLSNSGTFYNYSLPSSGIYNFSYISSTYITNSTLIKPSGSFLKTGIFVDTYGVFVKLYSSSPVDIQLVQVSGSSSPVFSGVSGTPYYNDIILGATPDFTNPFYFVVTSSGHTFDLSTFYISKTKMIYTNTITNTSGVEELNLTPSGTKIYNNSVPTQNSQMILVNMSFWNVTYVSGVLEKGTPFNILQGNYLYINGNQYSPSKPTSNNIANINYYYGSPSTSLSISLQINNGSALELIGYYGYYYMQESGTSITE